MLFCKDIQYKYIYITDMTPFHPESTTVRQRTQGRTCDGVDNSLCDSCGAVAGLALLHSLEGLHGGGGTDYICLQCQ